MELTPEIRQQLEEQKKQCIFCKIISGEQQGKTVFEDDTTQAILDIYPAKKGHTVFFLKEHYPIMPYIPADEFKHLFGLIPQLSKSIKDGIVTTGINIFIANGGPAGQQAPHFLIHLIPREEGDNFWNYFFDKRKAVLPQDKIQMLQNNFPIMMNNHFGRNPASWHSGKGNVPAFLTETYENSSVIYEDEKSLAIIPEKSMMEGHIEIYSKTEENNIESLSIEDASHLFYVASFAATAVFEGLGAHGTNIIVKSGVSDDNPGGKLSIHILPRMQEDGLHESLLWKPKQPDYDLDTIKSKIKDQTWKIKYGEKKKGAVKVASAPQVMKISDKVEKESAKENESTSAEDEIKKAIEGFK